MAKRPRATKRGRTFIQASRGVSSEQKAIYHQVAGAGKGRVLRKFFELSESDMDAIQHQAGAQLELHLR